MSNNCFVKPHRALHLHKTMWLTQSYNTGTQSFPKGKEKKNRLEPSRKKKDIFWKSKTPANGMMDRREEQYTHVILVNISSTEKCL